MTLLEAPIGSMLQLQPAHPPAADFPLFVWKDNSDPNTTGKPRGLRPLGGIGVTTYSINKLTAAGHDGEYGGPLPDVPPAEPEWSSGLVQEPAPDRNGSPTSDWCLVTPDPGMLPRLPPPGGEYHRVTGLQATSSCCGMTACCYQEQECCANAHWLDRVIRVLLFGKLTFFKLIIFRNNIEIKL